MPYVRDVAVTEFTATGTTTGTAEMPAHESGDMLIFFAVKDATGAITQSGSNYNALNSGASAGAWGGSWYRRAASNSEPGFVGTWLADSAVFVTVAVANVHATNNPTGVRSAADDTTIPYGGAASATTPSNNCLALYACVADNVQGPTGWPTKLQNLYAGDSGEAGLGVGWMFFPTSGTETNGVQFYSNLADDTRILTVMVEDSGSNAVKSAYVDTTSTAPNILSTLGGAALSFDGRSWSLPGTLTQPLYGTDFAAYYDFDGTNYTSDLTDINDVGTADVNPVNTTSGVMYFGFTAPFGQMALAVSTAGTGSPASVWEYRTSSGWSTLAGITTGVAGDLNFTAVGNKVYRWPIPSNWVAFELHASQAPGSYYYIRRRQTANWTIAAVLSQGVVNGMGALFDAVTSTGDTGANPYHASNALSGPATVPDTNNQAGNEFLSSVAIDMDPGYLLSRWRYVGPRDGIDCGLYKNHKGVCFGLIDTNNNYRMWTIAAKDARDSNYADATVFGIQPAQATPTYWAAQNVSGNFNANVIDTVILTGSSAYAALAGQFSQLLLVNGSVVISGGTSGTPLAFSDITDALIRGCGLFPVVRIADKAAIFYVPIQMGGADPAFFDVSLSTFQFPTQASAAKRTGTWHVDDGTVGIEFYGKTGETRKFAGCTFVSGSPYYWRFNASHSADATLDFSGATVVNALVTLRSTVTLSGVAFADCSTFTQNSATIIDCEFTNTKVSSSAPAAAALISNSTFTKTTGTQHAIEISGAAASFELSGVTFTGYASQDGSTGNEAIYVNTSSGSMTISITGGGSTPSIRAAAGVSVTVTNNRTVTLTGLKNPTEVRVFNAGTTTEISGTGNENVTTGTHAFSVAVGTNVDISIIALGYQNTRILDYSVDDDATIPISQVLDRQYFNP